MPDVFRVLELLVSKVTERYADEVDLVAYYGSYAQGTATTRSDLDFFYVPAEGRNPPVGRTVLIGGLLFDFWPIRWDTLDGFATGRIRGWSMAPALVYHAKVVYKRSEEAESRLQALQQKIADLQRPEAKTQMVRRALDAFPAVLGHLGNLRLAAAGGQLADVRHAGFQVLLSAWECLALANRAFFDRGFRSIVEQTSRLQAKPEGFEGLVETIGTSSDPREIVAAAEGLALGTREVLRRFQESLPAERSVSEQFDGAYPEIRDGLRKVISACEQGRRFDAGIAAWRQQAELGEMLAGLQRQIGSHPAFNLYREFSAAYEELGLPNLIGLASGDLVKLAEETELLDQRVQRWLREQSVSLQVYENIEEFARSL
ncbi:MAG: hypothetical protein ACYC9Q_06100 [Bacillota bacterium]